MRLLTLIEIELRKLFPFLISLFAFGTVLHTGWMVRSAYKMKDQVIRIAMEQELTIQQFVEQNGATLSLNAFFESTPVSLFIFGFTVLALIAIGFFSWYKEWFGVSKRIYTLLALKGSRLQIFVSKLTAFLCMFLAYEGFVLLNMIITSQLAQRILPEGSVLPGGVGNVLATSPIMGIAIPSSSGKFMFAVIFIVTMFTVLSAMVLLDRSFRIRGLIGAVVYGCVTLGVFIYIHTLPLFTTEMANARWLFVGTVLAFSMLVVNYLLKRKITV